MAQLRGKLESIDSLEQMLKRDGRQLLLMDMSGNRAKAAIGSGDVDNADHVAVFT